MKQIAFKNFDKFCEAKLCLPNKKEILYYSRLFGNRDWGFCIAGFYNEDLDNSGQLADYMQVQFFTHDIQFSNAGEIIANPQNKIMTLKGINAENYALACDWIVKQREVLIESVLELNGEENPLVDFEIQTEILEQKVVE